MSRTLHAAVLSGALSAVPVILGPRDQKNRLLYWTPELEAWCRQITATVRSRSLLSLSEQINLVFAEFISGRPMTSGLARCDPPKGEGIWRLKTTDVRLYGWAPARHTMILAAGELKTVLVAPGPPRDRDVGRRAVKVRSTFGLPFINGERYDLFPATN